MTYGIPCRDGNRSALRISMIALLAAASALLITFATERPGAQETTMHRASPGLRPDLTPEHRARARLGKVVFEQVWHPVGHKDTRADGLGPLFNDNSCVACHEGASRGDHPIGRGPQKRSWLRAACGGKFPGKARTACSAIRSKPGP